MDSQNKSKWYFETWSLVVAFICVGPFMLPLVWKHPRLSQKSKFIITALVIIVSYIMTIYLLKSLKIIASYYQLTVRRLLL